MTRNSSSPSVLIYRRGAIGDTLLTFPVFEVIKDLGYKVIAVGNTDILALAKLCSLVDEIYTELYPSLLEMPYQQKIFISKGGTIEPFPKERIWLPIYYLTSLNLPTKFRKKLPLPPTMLPQDRKNLIILHPGSGSKKKNAPFSLFERIEDFLKKEGYQVIYLAGPNETWLLDKKKNIFYTEDPLKIVPFLVQAKAFVGNDSGMSHLASYLGLPTFVFFGPTDEVVFHPIGERVYILKINLSCEPCFPKVCEERACLKEEILFPLFFSVWETNSKHL